MTARATSWRHSLLMLAILLLSLMLRVYRLAYFGLWIDEGYSVHLAGMPAAAVVAGTSADQHPPLYYLLLHGWLRVAGDSEYAARLLSVVIGVATVALVYAIGRRLCGTTCGTWAALLLALSPFHIRYSQETRMYVLLALLCALSVYGLYRWSRRPGGLWAVPYVVATAAALYTHNFALFVLLFEGIWMVIVALAQRRLGLLWRALGLQALAVVIWLPWLPTLLAQTRDHAMTWVSTPDAAAVRQTLLMLVTGARVDQIGPIPQPIYWLWLAAALAALAWAWWHNRAQHHSHLFLAAWFLIPAAGIVVAAMRYPLYQDKQFVFLLPALALTLAVGLAAIRPHWRALLLAGLIFLDLYPLYGLYHAWPRQDWRQAVAYLQEHSQEGDVIVLNPAASEIMLDYYSGPALPRAGFPADYDVLVGGFAGQVTTRESAAGKLAPLLDSYRQIWLLEFTPGFWDPEGYIAAWLEQHTTPARTTEFADLTLRLFRVD